VAEKAAAGRFAVYRECVDDDPVTREIFEQILRDEVFHMNYSYAQLGRLSPQALADTSGGARQPLVEALLATRRGVARSSAGSVHDGVLRGSFRRFAWPPSAPPDAKRPDGPACRRVPERPTSQY